MEAVVTPLDRAAARKAGDIEALEMYRRAMRAMEHKALDAALFVGRPLGFGLGG
jgi:hypothetical protein